MIVPERIPLSRLTANALEEEILNGRWQTRLPGYRQLCNDLRVSRKTLVDALEILTRRDLLEPPNGTRPRRLKHTITEQHQHHRPSTARRVLICVAGDNSALERDSPLSMFDQVFSHFNQRGWKCLLIHSNEAGTRPGTKLNQLHSDYPHARWLFGMPSLEVCRWCVRKRIRAVAYGGDIGNTGLPVVGASLSQMLIIAHKHLSSLGHKSIVVLTIEPLAKTVKTYADYLHSRGIQFRNSYHMPDLSGMTREKFNAMLTELHRVTPPTAMVITSHLQLLGVLGYCAQHNLKIPDDLSIILGNDLDYLDWYSPGLSCFHRDSQSEQQALIRLIRSYPAKKVKPLTLPPHLTDKGSVSRPHR
ncbi:MAG: substrate-binding domain-containing protein [Akkermansiaceae bacterium]|nr:substrate-binding domain-containing protein [Akkermansiaceae bacterium]